MWKKWRKRVLIVRKKCQLINTLHIQSFVSLLFGSIWKIRSNHISPRLLLHDPTILCLRSRFPKLINCRWFDTLNLQTAPLHRISICLCVASKIQSDCTLFPKQRRKKNMSGTRRAHSHLDVLNCCFGFFGWWCDIYRVSFHGSHAINTNKHIADRCAFAQQRLIQTDCNTFHFIMSSFVFIWLSNLLVNV